MVHPDSKAAQELSESRKPGLGRVSEEGSGYPRRNQLGETASRGQEDMVECLAGVAFGYEKRFYAARQKEFFLVVVDHFTQYIQAFVTKNHTAKTMARVLYNNYFSVFSFLQRLMSDQGMEFCGKVIAAMCSLLGVEKIWTSPYHPQTNGSAERVHQMLQRMIGKLDPEKRRKWLAHIGSIIIAYNSTRSLVTRYSPYYLMFGQ